MDAPAVGVKRFVRPSLLAIVLYILVIMLSSITMIKPAQAEGTVSPLFSYCATVWFVGGSHTSACETSYSKACNAISLPITGVSSTYSLSCGYCVINSNCSRPPYFADQNFNTTSVCPNNSTGDRPINPKECICNTGYHPNDLKTQCIQESLTISLYIPPPAEVEPSATKSAYAQVLDGSSPKSGVQVNLTVTPPTGGGIATLVPASGATGSEGKLAFDFVAPAVAGSYSITASCDPACSNQATGAIEVKAKCPVDPLPKPPFDGDVDPACTASLEKGKGKDVDNVCPSLNPKMTEPNGGQMQCLADKINKLALTPAYTGPSSTIRTEAYQQHFVDIWDKWTDIKSQDLSDEEKLVCAVEIADVEAEMKRHGIDAPPSKKKSQAPHVLGNALDIPKEVAKALMAKVTNTNYITFIPPFCFICMPVPVYIGDVQDYVDSALVNPPACDLRWGGNFDDKVHFHLRHP